MRQQDKQKRSTGQKRAAALARPDVKSRIAADRPLTGHYSPNPINVWGIAPRDLPMFTFFMVRSMLWDPTIQLGLAMRAAPLHGIQFAYQDPADDKNWIPGFKASSPEVAAWALRQFRHIWAHDLGNLLKDQIWGWSGGEVLWHLDRAGQIHVGKLLTRHAADIRALELEGKLWGVRFHRVPEWKAEHLDIEFPKSFWHAFFPEDGSNYGISILRGAYSPWADKWLDGGALDVRRLFMHKDAYGGMDISYPPGTTDVPNPNGDGDLVIPNGDIARQMVEQARAGQVISCPTEYDKNGNPLWKVNWAKVPSNPTHILQYPKDLDIEMTRGMQIPDEVVISQLTGSWNGKAVGQTAFYVGLDRWATSLIANLKAQIVDQGLYMNFGPDAWFEASHKPLAQQVSEQQQDPNKKDDGGPSGGREQSDSYGGQYDSGRSEGRPGQQSMSLGRRRQQVAEAIVGEGILGAAKLVKAVRQKMDRRLRMGSDDNPWTAFKGPRGGQGWRNTRTGAVVYQADRPGRHGENEVAPKGGITLGGKRYEPHEKIPAEVIEDLSPTEQAKLRYVRTAGDSAKADAREKNDELPTLHGANRFKDWTPDEHNVAVSLEKRARDAGLPLEKILNAQGFKEHIGFDNLRLAAQAILVAKKSGAPDLTEYARSHGFGTVQSMVVAGQRARARGEKSPLPEPMEKVLSQDKSVRFRMAAKPAVRL